MKPSQRLMTSLPWLTSWAVFSSIITFASLAAPVESSRQIVLLPPSGSESSDQEILRWQQRILDKPAESAYWERLGWAYIAKARRQQDPGFYKLAELTVDAGESAGGTNAGTQLLRGHVYHNLHRFKDAEAIARSLVATRKSPADYALLCDALMEQGKLDEAVEACQALTDLRPGVEAFSRVAHLRWLFGDLGGACDAMRSAAHCAHPRDQETRAWLYTRLAGYELLKGRSLEAVALCEAVLSAVPEYPPALAIKGRALYSTGHYDGAIALLRRAAEHNPLPDNQWWLADALRAQGQEDAAHQIEAKLRRHGPATDPRTVSLFLATRGEDLDRAISLANEELKSRSDIFTHDALAFALFRAGRSAEATAEMSQATAHLTDEPRLALHAGLLAEDQGDQATAVRNYQRAKVMAAALTPSEQALLSSRLRGQPVAAR